MQEFNKRIADFDYGYSKLTSKPSIIKPQHLIPGGNIKQSASQMWLLGLILPFVVQDIIEEDCPFYENYLTLLQITCIVFGHSISLGHYPRWILYFGLLVEFMCMNLERKHQQFKRISQGLRSYKNLPYTFSVRHQQWLAFQLMKSLTKEIINGPRKLVPTINLPFKNLFPDNPLLCTVPWLKYNGIKYTAGKCFIAIGYSSPHPLPQFAALHSIIATDLEPIFICKKVQTILHDMNLMAYKVVIQNDFVSYTAQDLVTHNVFHSHKYEESIYIIVKRYFGDIH